MSNSPIRTTREGVISPRWLGWALLFAIWCGALYGAGQWAYSRERLVLDQQAERDLSVRVLSFRGTALRYKHIPFTSSHQNDVLALLQSQRDMALVSKVDVYLEEINRRIGADALYLLNKKGGCISASNWNDPSTFKGDTYHYRPYFQEAAAGRLGVYYAVGTSTGLPGIFYASPVYDKGAVAGVLVVKVALKDIERSWIASAAPVFLLDTNGIIMLGSWTDYLYTASQPLSAEKLQTIQFNRQYGSSSDGSPRQFTATPWKLFESQPDGYWTMSVTREGVPRSYLVKLEHLPEFDWTLMVTADLNSAEWARWIGVAITGALSLALFFAVLFMQSLSQSRRELVTKVRERTRELAESIAFRKAMEDSLLVGMRARDLDGRVIYVNPALCEITGFSSENLVGKLPPYPYWHPEEMEKHWRDNAIGLQGKAAPTGYESRFRHRHGHDIYLMIYTAPLIDASGKHAGWMSSMVDVTAQKAAEDQQRQQVAKMQRTGRMASMGEMASTLAHELGNPLMSISSYAATAKTYAQKGHQELLLETLGEIGEQSQRAAEIVRRIRGFVRQHTPGFSHCAVNDVVANVLSLVRPEMRHQRAKAVTRLGADLPLIQADKLLLEQVLLNLVVNAVQAMQDKFPADKIVQIDTGLQAGSIFIRVSDRGPGIPEEVAKQLFAPFFTTKPEGLGLGLNICRTTVEAHRGSLVFENRPDGGASFTVLLPLSP